MKENGGRKSRDTVPLNSLLQKTHPLYFVAGQHKVQNSHKNYFIRHLNFPSIFHKN
jgi:hypothetical protein